MDKKTFIQILKKNENISITLVIECKKSKKLLGSLKLLFEQKFFKNGCLCVYYEDLIIDKDHRKKGLGTLINKIALEIC